MELNRTYFPMLAPFEFENYVDGEDIIRDRKERWHLTIGYSVIYLATVFSLRAFMKDRKEFQLHYILVLWNLAMALVSIFASIRMVPGYLHLVWDHSYAFSICDQKYGLKMQPSVFWGYVFSWLKVLEFGDTIFLVLRKRKLTFLHCYHHAMTTLMTEYSIATRIPVGHGFIVANYIIHSLMYSYYTLMVLKMRVPKIVSMTLTTLQILQMVFGTFQCYCAFYYRANRNDCNFPLAPITFVICMYLSYFMLFCYYFYSTYIVAPKKSKVY